MPNIPNILRRFECHANIELCISRVGSIKYLFKYVCKVQDRISMELLKDGNVVYEIRSFQDARYVSASEAAWRLLYFNIVKRFHLLHHYKYISYITTHCITTKNRSRLQQIVIVLLQPLLGGSKHMKHIMKLKKFGTMIFQSTSLGPNELLGVQN